MVDFSLSDKLKELRTQKNVTQKQVANALYIAETTYEKWEKGIHTPTLPSIMALCQYYKCSFSDFVGHEYSVLADLNIGSPFEFAPEPSVSSGYAQVAYAWNTYHTIYDSLQSLILCSPDNINQDMYPHISGPELRYVMSYADTYTVFADRCTGEVIGMRDFGRYNIQPCDIVLSSQYVPIKLIDYTDETRLTQIAQMTIDKFNKELDEITKSHAKPLILLAHLGMDNYLAWSVADNCYKNVYEYKEYRDTFGVSDCDVTDPEHINYDHDYVITHFSRSLNEDMGLVLYEDSWTKLREYNTWEYRPPRPMIIDNPIDPDVYAQAINKCNIARDHDVSNLKDYVRLEDRLDRYEHAVRNNYPDKFINDEFNLIKKSLDIID